MIPRHYFNAVTGSTTDADRCVFTNTQAASEDLWRRAPTVESPVLVSLIWLEGCTSQRLLSFTVNTSQVETQNARDAFILKLFHETFGRHGWVSDNLIKTGRKNRQWLVLVGYEKHCRLLEMSSELKNQAMGRKKKKMAHRVFRVDPWLLLCLQAIKKAVRPSVSLDTDWSWSLHKWMHLLFKHKDRH